MANVLSKEKKQRVRVLGELGWSLRRIEEETGIRRETASKHLKAMGVSVRAPRKRQLAKAASEVSTTEAKAASEVSMPAAALERPSSSRQGSRCEAHREFIELSLLKGRNAMVIWQDLVDDHEFDAGYASVMRFVRKLRPTSPREFAVITTGPGEESQVDYGDGPMVLGSDGRHRRTRLFVLTLACSRRSVWLVVPRSSSKVWAQLHEKAFVRLGGATKIVVLDNLKEGVLAPDVYDPELNPLYRDVLAHYGSVALPCRVRDPNRKGKVEAAVKLGQQKLRGMRFASIEEAQTYVDRWAETWADQRVHGTTKRRVADMFAEERPHLLPLPLERFCYYAYGTRVVHSTARVEVAGDYYDVPAGHIGKRLGVQWNDAVVRILGVEGQLLREHRRETPSGKRTALPESKTSRRLAKVIEQAAHIGPSVANVCRNIASAEQEAVAERYVRGVINLAKKHGAQDLEHACGFALEHHLATYRFIRRYLEHRPTTGTALRQIDPLIRELSNYKALLEQRMEEHLEHDRTESSPSPAPTVGNGGDPGDAPSAGPDRHVASQRDVVGTGTGRTDAAG